MGVGGYRHPSSESFILVADCAALSADGTFLSASFIILSTGI
jgi:hypothetical protein